MRVSSSASKYVLEGVVWWAPVRLSIFGHRERARGDDANEVVRHEQHDFWRAAEMLVAQRGVVAPSCKACAFQEEERNGDSSAARKRPLEVSQKKLQAVRLS